MTPTAPALSAVGSSRRASGASACRAAPARSRGAVPGPAPAPAVPATRSRIRPRIAFDHLGERRVEVRYEVHGSPARVRPRPRTGPVGSVPAPTVVLGGISAGRHLAPAPFDAAPGWWPGLVGRGEVLDPARRLLVGVDYLGGVGPGGGADGPGTVGRQRAAIRPGTARRPLRPVTTRDQARAVASVLDHLGIAAASFVGASYGGMVALAFAELLPARVDRLVVLCAAHRTHPMATAVRSVQRAAASLGADAGDSARGLALARALAMTTYRSAREFEARFSPFAPVADDPAVPSTARGPARFPVEEYLEARGAAFARTFDADRFLALSESIDLHATLPRSLPAHALLVSFDSDVLVPPWLMRELAARQGRRPARHVTIPSLYGHDAFLKETEAVSGCLRRELDGEEAVR